MVCKLLSVFLIAIISLVLNKTGSEAQSIGSGPLTISLAPVEVRNDSGNQPGSVTTDSLQEFIARQVTELLPSYLQRGFEKGLDRRVIIANDSTAPNSSSTISISPVIITGMLGVRVSVKLVAGQERPFDRATSGGAAATEELLLSPHTDFGEIDEKLGEFSLRIAKRVIDTSNGTQSATRRTPRGIVRVDCITSLDSDLQALSRLLTIELPYHLSEARLVGNLAWIFR